MNQKIEINGLSVTLARELRASCADVYTDDGDAGCIMSISERTQRAFVTGRNVHRWVALDTLTTFLTHEQCGFVADERVETGRVRALIYGGNPDEALLATLSGVGYETKIYGGVDSSSYVVVCNASGPAPTATTTEVRVWRFKDGVGAGHAWRHMMSVLNDEIATDLIENAS